MIFFFGISNSTDALNHSITSVFATLAYVIIYLAAAQIFFGSVCSDLFTTMHYNNIFYK